MYSRLRLITVLSVVALLAVGCGSSKKTSTTVRSTTPAASAPASTATPAAGGLSGRWTGQYSGVYSGTFTINWQQTGSRLGGNIKLSSPASTLGITGTVTGSAIHFGAVGDVTYTGSVSGNNMSGSYQSVTGGGGSWSASKAS